MARAAASTSAETSRLAPRNFPKSLVEIGAAAVQANGHGDFLDAGFRELLQWRGGVAPSTLGDPINPGVQPEGQVTSSTSPAPSSSGPKSVSSHSRHSTSSRSAPPWAKISSALPPGASAHEIRSRPVPARCPGLARSMLRDLQASTRSKRSAATSRRGSVCPTATAPSRAGSCRSRGASRLWRQTMSEVDTRASCTCAEITARSSASSAISLSCGAIWVSR